MKNKGYRSLEIKDEVNRREFLKLSSGLGSVVGVGLLLGTPPVWSSKNGLASQENQTKTNIKDALAVARTKTSLPGPFPGRVIEIHDPKAMTEDKPAPEIIDAMVKKGITRLTGKNMAESFPLFFKKSDIVGIKVNPVGPGLISTRLEVVDAVIDWLLKGGLKRENIIIWDRFDYMLKDAGFTPERYPGIGIEGLQTMDEEAAAGKKQDDSAWLDKSGHHVSEKNFDKNCFYWADVEGPKTKPISINMSLVVNTHISENSLLKNLPRSLISLFLKIQAPAYPWPQKISAMALSATLTGSINHYFSMSVQKFMLSRSFVTNLCST